MIDLPLLSLLAPMQESNIEAGVCNWSDIFSFDQQYSISIPDYQRPFVWDESKVSTLVNDWQQYLKETDIPFYYMGGILFYNKKDTNGNTQYEIIDGQQRLTTLLIIDYLINSNSSVLHKNEINLKLVFNNSISQNHIIKIKDYIKGEFETFKLAWDKIREKLLFSLIITYNQDDAFSFFETQNNRGVKLSSVDYLKSYHLRELKNDMDKQRVLAKKWDSSNKEQFLKGLYENILYRSRCWKGKDVEYANQKNILEEFQTKTITSNKENSISLFPTRNNCLAQSMSYSVTKGIKLNTQDISLHSNSIDLPFAMRQPLEKGIGFFLYTDKYSEMYNYLFDDQNTDTDFANFKDFYRKIYLNNGLSIYLVELFKLCCMFYFDKFGVNRLFDFANYLDYMIGSYRITQSSIVARTSVKILRDKQQNLLDIIAYSFVPQEVFDFIVANTDENIYKNDTIEINANVRGRYKKSIVDYFRLPNSLKNRKQFLNDKK
ncbi:DUF262 domain-containing protein [Dysgonomonas sp. ZJ279]|uniref:DUF262 domain-containing protein n=1 Tax=Dysgonomonas sp. ZJ279 TaxID=2709796 RepID=UPI0013EDF0EE|nr:DUF262 domain-containing protein [Dysgonomonas sp. ZJ279]